METDGEGMRGQKPAQRMALEQRSLSAGRPLGTERPEEEEFLETGLSETCELFDRNKIGFIPHKRCHGPRGLTSRNISLDGRNLNTSPGSTARTGSVSESFGRHDMQWECRRCGTGECG